MPEAVAPAGPLSPAHIAQLNEARARSRKVRRAAAVAAVSGWTLAFFAGITLLFAVFGDLVSLILGVALAVCATCELRGGAALRRLDPRAAKRLAVNQLVLGVIIVAYSGWSLNSALHDPKLASLSGGSGDPQIDQTIQQITMAATWGLYGTLAIFGVLGPGLTAWYYASRGAVVRRFISQTPAWVVETMRATG